MALVTAVHIFKKSFKYSYTFIKAVDNISLQAHYGYLPHCLIDLKQNNLIFLFHLIWASSDSFTEKAGGSNCCSLVKSHSNTLCHTKCEHSAELIVRWKSRGHRLVTSNFGMKHQTNSWHIPQWPLLLQILEQNVICLTGNTMTAEEAPTQLGTLFVWLPIGGWSQLRN